MNVFFLNNYDSKIKEGKFMLIITKEFTTLPIDIRKKVSCFIQEYITVDKEKGFDENGEILEKVYKQSFSVLVTEDVFTIKELRRTLFEDYHVLLPIEWFGGTSIE